MLRIGVIGIGNTGNQIAALAMEELKIPVIAINSSEHDLEQVPNGVTKLLISDKDGHTHGAGKNRKLAKKFLKDSISGLVNKDEVSNLMENVDVAFVVSSTGGGTGSGTALVMTDILQSIYSDVKVIIVGVTPSNNEALSSHVNSLEYLNELYNVLDKPTYMLYDNDRVEGRSYEVINKVNEEIVKDFNVLRLYYNLPTKFDSIDERDGTRLISFAGRIVVVRLEDFKEKDCDTRSIESMIIDTLNRNCHAECQRDKKVMATGLIANMSQQLFDVFDDNLPEVRKFVGDPVHGFRHIHVNEDRKDINNLFFIMSGLSAVNDTIHNTNETIDQINENQRKLEEEQAALDGENLKVLSEKISSDDKKDTTEDKGANISSIFRKFDV